MYASVSGHGNGGGSGKHYPKKSRQGRRDRSLYRRVVSFVTQYVTGAQFKTGGFYIYHQRLVADTVWLKTLYPCGCRLLLSGTTCLV